MDIIFNRTNYDFDIIREQIDNESYWARAAKRQREAEEMHELFKKWADGTATIDDEPILI